MSDKVELDVETEAGDGVKPEVKQFTQAEVDKIVKSRLDREAKKHEADLEDYKLLQKEHKQLLSEREAELKLQIEALSGDLTDDTRELLAELSPDKQLAWLNKNVKKDEPKPTMPVTPKASSKGQKFEPTKAVGRFI